MLIPELRNGEDIAVIPLLMLKASKIGHDRIASIIANNYIVRKMCYPVVALPILYILLRMRILKHGFYRNKYNKLIKEMIKNRYSK